jgi:predicted GNAT family N-acyltransferase
MRLTNGIATCTVGDGYLMNLWTPEAERNQGHAANLMALAIESGANALHCRPHLTSFYEAFGFAATGTNQMGRNIEMKRPTA